MRLASCSRFWARAYRCTYTKICTKQGNTVIQSHVILFCFSLHHQLKQSLTYCGVTVSLLPPREGKIPWRWQHLSALVAPADFPRESVWELHTGAALGTSLAISPTRHWVCGPCWRCSWRPLCKAQRCWCTCAHSGGSQVLSKCLQQCCCRENSTVHSDGCYFRIHQLLVYTPLLAALQGLLLFQDKLCVRYCVVAPVPIKALLKINKINPVCTFKSWHPPHIWK